MGVNFKKLFLWFLFPTGAAIMVILWPQRYQPPAFSQTFTAPPESSGAEPEEGFAARYSYPQSKPARRGETAAVDDITSLRPDADTAPKAEATPEPLIPAAFADPGSGNHLTPEEMDALRNMRKDFADAMQEGKSNPNTPAYYQRWKELQADFDERFRSEFGDEAYNEYQNSTLHAPPPSQ